MRYIALRSDWDTGPSSPLLGPSFIASRYRLEIGQHGCTLLPTGDLITNGNFMESTAMNDTERPVTDIEAAERLGISAKTLKAWRVRGTGPRFFKAGRAV